MRSGAIERAYEDFQRGRIKRTGLMIHYVIQEVDRGAPIVTQEVGINSDDSLEDVQVSASPENISVFGAFWRLCNCKLSRNYET